MICPAVCYIFFLTIWIKCQNNATSFGRPQQGQGQRSGTTSSNKNHVLYLHNPFFNAEWKKKKRFSSRQGNIFVTSSLFLALSLPLCLSAWGQMLFFRPHGDHVRWIRWCILALLTVRGGSQSQKLKNYKNQLASRTILINTDPSTRQ